MMKMDSRDFWDIPEDLPENGLICRVCREVAPELVKKVHYYGAVCCSSCKGFFRRATKNCQHSKFKCNNGFNLMDRANEKCNDSSNPIENGPSITTKKTPQCGVDVKTRRQCQYCRYKRCIEIGMTPTLVLTDAQKLERFSSKKQNPKQHSIVLGTEKSDVCSHTYNETSKEPAIANMLGSTNRYSNPTYSKFRTVSQDPQEHIHGGIDEKASTVTKHSPSKNNNITLDINPQQPDQQKSIIFQPNSYYLDGLQKRTDSKEISDQKEVPSLKQSTQVEGQQIAYNEKEYNRVNLQNLQHSKNENQSTYLSFINEIFDAFEASMRATPTSPEFVYSLINLHQNDISGHTNRLDLRRDANFQSGPTIEQLFRHIQNVQNSFMKFAYSCKAFRNLLHTDQKELLRKNGLMFVMYILSRYFSSDVAIEQLTWLIKGCGTYYLPVGFVNDTDILDISAVSFKEFNRICKIVDPNKKCGEYYERYAACIENIKNGFQYPQYYNGLIGLLLLFSHDPSYHFYNPIQVKKVLEETKRVVMAGYADFEQFGIAELDNLISTIREMSNVFKIIHGTKLSFYKEETYDEKVSEIECYVDENGKRVQIKPLNFSTKSELKRRKPDPLLKASQHLAQRNHEYHSAEQMMRSFKRFEQIFASVTCGSLLTTVIDVGVGRLKPQDLPPNYVRTGVKMFVERLRRGLCIHPEFSDQLSDFDKSLLWKKNFSLAGALSMVKIASCKNGLEQFMYRNGQLREESNALWFLEFKGYHGLQSINDFPMFTIDSVSKGWAYEAVTKKQIIILKTSMKELAPLIRDTISFYLLTMIMMFDTSDLNESKDQWDDEHPKYSLEPVNMDDNHRIKDISGIQTPTSSSSISTTSSYGSNMESLSNDSICKVSFQKGKRCKPNIDERFSGISDLRDVYLSLLMNRCKISGEPEIKKFGDSNIEMNRAINSMKKISKFMSTLMKLYETD